MVYRKSKSYLNRYKKGTYKKKYSPKYRRRLRLGNRYKNTYKKMKSKGINIRYGYGGRQQKRLATSLYVLKASEEVTIGSMQIGSGTTFLTSRYQQVDKLTDEGSLGASNKKFASINGYVAPIFEKLASSIPDKMFKDDSLAVPLSGFLQTPPIITKYTTVENASNTGFIHVLSFHEPLIISQASVQWLDGLFNTPVITKASLKYSSVTAVSNYLMNCTCTIVADPSIGDPNRTDSKVINPHATLNAMGCWFWALGIPESERGKSHLYINEFQPNDTQGIIKNTINQLKTLESASAYLIQKFKSLCLDHLPDLYADWCEQVALNPDAKTDFGSHMTFYIGGSDNNFYLSTKITHGIGSNFKEWIGSTYTQVEAYFNGNIALNRGMTLKTTVADQKWLGIQKIDKNEGFNIKVIKAMKIADYTANEVQKSWRMWIKEIIKTVFASQFFQTNDSLRHWDWTTMSLYYKLSFTKHDQSFDYLDDSYRPKYSNKMFNQCIKDKLITVKLVDPKKPSIYKVKDSPSISHAVVLDGCYAKVVTYYSRDFSAFMKLFTDAVKTERLYPLLTHGARAIWKKLEPAFNFQIV